MAQKEYEIGAAAGKKQFEYEDVPKWYDPPIEEDPKWLINLRAVFRIAVVCIPFIFAAVVISSFSPAAVIFVPVVFLLLLWIAKNKW